MKEELLAKFGINADPFDIRNPTEKLIGEEQQEKNLIKFMAQDRAMLLHGETGSGKTTMITNLCKRINANEIEELKGCKCLLYGDKSNLKDFSRKLLLHKLFGFGKHLIIMVDEIAFSNEDNLMTISVAWDNKKIKSIVYVQISDTPKYDKLWRRIGEFKVRMKLISEFEIYEMLKVRQGDLLMFHPDALKYISYNCNNSPSAALQRCSWMVDELSDGKTPIALEHVKQFYQNNFKTESDKKEKLPAPVKDENDKISQLNNSPLEKDVIRQLRISSMTQKQLSEALKTDNKSIAARISSLKKEKKVIVVDPKRPKKFGLTPEFERKLLTDVKENTSNKKVENK